MHNTLFEIHQPLLIQLIMSSFPFLCYSVIFEKQSPLWEPLPTTYYYYHIAVSTPQVEIYATATTTQLQCITTIIHVSTTTTKRLHFTTTTAYIPLSESKKLKEYLKKPLSTLCTIGNSAIILVCDRSMLTIFPRTSPLLLRSAT